MGMGNPTVCGHRVLKNPLLQMLLHILLLLPLLSDVAVSQSIIKTLPGFAGNLPFKLETGYVGVGSMDEVQLYYYFIESERSPKNDPLMLWLTGGPGCSAFSGLVYEIGPLVFDYANSSGKKPVFTLNPYSWTKVANIIFLDSPVGTGFSYATTSEAYSSSDTLQAADIYTFIRKWLMTHPKFLTNPLYISGDSYSGILVPMIVQEISNGNEIGLEPHMNLQGYVLGNPLTDTNSDLNSRIPFAYLKALISKKLYEYTKKNCKGEYVNADLSNAQCVSGLLNISECTDKLYMAQILEPSCTALSPRPMISKWDLNFLGENSMDFLQISQHHIAGPWCRAYNYIYSYIWANDKTVQKALHIREGSIKDWVRCNYSLSYTKNVASSVNYHRNLTKKNCRALIYSGDHDMAIPHVGTEEWIESLGLEVAHQWGPWFVDGQIAGYTVNYSSKKYRLTYVSVKGGGHTAPEYKPKECLAMIERWFAYYPL